MEQAAGECGKTGKTCPNIEFKERSMKTEAVPAASNKSNPISAARKLLTGVVGPFRA